MHAVVLVLGERAIVTVDQDMEVTRVRGGCGSNSEGGSSGGANSGTGGNSNDSGTYSGQS